MTAPYRTPARRTIDGASQERTDAARAVTVVLVAAAALMVATALRPSASGDAHADRARLGAGRHAREASSPRGR